MVLPFGMSPARNGSPKVIGTCCNARWDKLTAVTSACGRAPTGLMTGPLGAPCAQPASAPASMKHAEQRNRGFLTANFGVLLPRAIILYLFRQWGTPRGSAAFD